MLDEGLFRREALDEYRSRVSGEPIAPLPSSWAWLAGLIILFLIAVGFYLSFNEYARKERVSGALRFADGEVVIEAPMHGTVMALTVAEGDWVDPDTPLFTIRTTERSAEGVEFPAEYARSIEEELTILREQAATNDIILQSQSDELMAQISSFESQIEAIDERLAVGRERRALLQAQFDAGLELNQRGNLAARALEERRLLVLDQNERTTSLLAQRADFVGAVNARRARLRQLPHEFQQAELANAQAELQLRRRLLEMGVQRGVLITAPSAGQVAALAMENGESIQAGQRALTLVAAGSEIEGVVYLPSRAMARIRPGLEVRLFYHAYPHRRYGVATGRIGEVSNTVYRPEEIPSHFRIEEAAYRAVVKLDSQTVTAFDTDFPLRSGMTFNAEVILERQTFISWLFEPFQG